MAQTSLKQVGRRPEASRDAIESIEQTSTKLLLVASGQQNSWQ